MKCSRYPGPIDADAKESILVAVMTDREEFQSHPGCLPSGTVPASFWVGMSNLQVIACTKFLESYRMDRHEEECYVQRVRSCTVMTANRMEQIIEANLQSTCWAWEEPRVDQEPGKDQLEKWNGRRTKDLNFRTRVTGLIYTAGQQAAAR